MKKFLILGLALAFCFMATLPAAADTVNWTQWSGTFTTSSSAGSASGTSGAIGVIYSGELETIMFGYPGWGQPGTFSGGTISNAPPSAGGIIQLFGGGASTAPIVNTITFSQAVTNPVMAIWSLGQNGNISQFNFGAQSFSIQSGGPSGEYGGSSIYSCNAGTTICGEEGNGTIMFNGTFNSITWTNPVYENWYGFTVGTFEPERNPQVPEPSSIAFLASGLGSLGLLRRKLIGR
ncbi:MAG TPA: PEP-CTERM sorting domain-containing protein [Terriglobales bacterium]|nr:PEP-CTERM sorting domain-containing protein [Terriglobales bacterium]